MMSSPVPSDDTDSYEPWDAFEFSSQQNTQANKLELCQYANWSPERTYDEDPPSYIHYSIEWKITVNNRAIMPKDTEQDLVLEPAAYWEHFLEPKLKNVLFKKNRPLTSEDTTVVVSVTERSERDLTKRFDETNIDWAVIKKQLVAWGELFRVGKKLRLILSFNYIDSSQSSTALLRGPNQRCRSSTTNQMLTERAAQLDAEESSGQPSIWREVYNLMRCPGPPCDLGPYCWCDPDGKKHYKLNTHHLRSLIRYVEQGHELRTHNDMPKHIRDQLYAEEQQWLRRHQKATSAPAANFPPINITNVLPGQSHRIPPLGSSPAETPAPDMPQIPVTINRLDIPGTRDEAVEEYCAWQQMQVKKLDLKAEFQKACDLIIEDGLDLELVHQDQNPDFLVKRGIKRGIAQRVVGDIGYWVKKFKQAETQD
jgi:hypothetical protein